jgi:hypothetical protein
MQGLYGLLGIIVMHGCTVVHVERAFLVRIGLLGMLVTLATPVFMVLDGKNPLLVMDGLYGFMVLFAIVA